MRWWVGPSGAVDVVAGWRSVLGGGVAWVAERLVYGLVVDLECEVGTYLVKSRAFSGRRCLRHQRNVVRVQREGRRVVANRSGLRGLIGALLTTHPP
jgi:hypothetical protein